MNYKHVLTLSRSLLVDVLPPPKTLLLFTLSISGLQLVSADVIPLNWVDLLPEHDKKILANPPVSLTSIPDGSDLDIIPNKHTHGKTENDLPDKPRSAEEKAYFKSLDSIKTNSLCDLYKGARPRVNV